MSDGGARPKRDPDAEQRLQEVDVGGLVFPLVYSEINHYPRNGICSWCGGKIGDTVFSLEGGSHLMDSDREEGRPDDRMEAFLSLTWRFYGTEEIQRADEDGLYLPIAEDVVGGQFVIYFCSARCMRSLLCDCVDQLEAKVEPLSQEG